MYFRPWLLTRHERLKTTLILHKCMRILGRIHYVALLGSALRSLAIQHIHISGPFEVTDVAVFSLNGVNLGYSFDCYTQRC